MHVLSMIFHLLFFTAQPSVSTAGTLSNIDYKTDVKKEQDETQYVQDLGELTVNFYVPAYTCIDV